MTAVGRRPYLEELLQALHAIERVEADAGALDPESKTFRIVLTFNRERCPRDWAEGRPKPTWLFEGILEELQAWLKQRMREEQWVAEEAEMGCSIDTLMAHWGEELRKTAAAPQNILTRAQSRILSDSIIRLKELKERREAGGVHSQTESRREKARKAWVEDEFEAPNREEEQRRRREEAAGPDDPEWFEKVYEQMRAQAQKDWGRVFEEAFTHGARPPPPKQKSNSKRPWHEVLDVPSTATPVECRRAYRRLAAKYHPDRYKGKDGDERMAEINVARDESPGA